MIFGGLREKSGLIEIMIAWVCRKSDEKEGVPITEIVFEEAGQYTNCIDFDPPALTRTQAACSSSTAPTSKNSS